MNSTNKNNMIRQHLLFYCLVFCLLACNEQVKETGVNEIKVTIRNSELKTSELFTAAIPIRLETKEESLLQDISKAYLSEKYLFIKSGHALFLFDREGTFIRKIEKQGSGPTEYNRLSDFDINERNKEIYILDKGLQKVLVYGFDGEYKRENTIGIEAVKILNLDDNTNYTYSGNEESSNNRHKINLYSGSEINHSFNPIDERKKGYLHVNSSQNFYRNENGEILFFEAFNDTIYNLSEQMLSPKYVINYEKGAPDSFFDRNFANIMEFFMEYNKQGYTNSTYNVFENGENVYFSCFQGGVKYFNRYQKATDICSSYNRINDDMLFEDFEIPFSDDFFEFWTNRNSEIIYFITAEWAKDNIDKIRDSEFRKMVAELEEDSNPIAIFCRQK